MGCVRYRSRTISGKFADNSAGSGQNRASWPVLRAAAMVRVSFHSASPDIPDNEAPRWWTVQRLAEGQ